MTNRNVPGVKTMDKTIFSRTRSGLALAAVLAFLAACADEPTLPRDAADEAVGDAPAFATLLTCAVDVRAGSMECDPSSPSGAAGGPSMNLIVGSQHHFVRLANDTPVIEGDSWSANVTVQNLTLQPMGTLDGSTPHADGVRVFFVDEPSNGVSIADWDGVGGFLGGKPTWFHQYGGAALLGADGILEQGEVSGAKPWEFELNGATTFRFSVLVSTTVPDPGAYSVHLTRVGTGGSHACGEGSDGKLYCWGQNYHGQLGDGTRTLRTTPVAVRAPDGVELSGVSLHSNGSHTCALGSDSKVYCWGINDHGQIGDGTTELRTSPVAVQGLPNVAFTAVAVGGTYTCAESSEGTVYCWGNNEDGQLGDSTTVSSLTPVAVRAPEGVRLSGVSAGIWHTCAQGSDSKVYCWGENVSGQLGDGTTTSRTTPVAVVAPENVTLTAVSVGGSFTCAHGSDDELYCWGYNSWGQLGNGSTSAREPVTPVIAPDEVTFSGVAAGPAHSCARGSDSKLYCWGRNIVGGLGNGTNTDSATPVVVSLPEVNALNVSAGGSFTCAATDRGAYCWGSGYAGQNGDGATLNRYLPVRVAGTRGP